MKRFSGFIGVDQGSRTLFSDFAHDGPMWTCFGPREVRLHQPFQEKFAEAPIVTIGISMWDLDHNTNARVDILAENITATGFEIVFRTWADTRIARIRADWLAIGSLKDDEVWDVD